MDRYKYSVTPFIPIKDLIPGKLIRKPFSTDLTKEEVLLCMKHGPVHRLFVGMKPIKVTGSNIDFLHRPTYEEEPYVEEVVQSPQIQQEEEVVQEYQYKEEYIKEEENPVTEQEEIYAPQDTEEENIKLFDRDEIRENFAVQETDIANEVSEEEPVEYSVNEEYKLQNNNHNINSNHYRKKNKKNRNTQYVVNENTNNDNQEN